MSTGFQPIYYFAWNLNKRSELLSFQGEKRREPSGPNEIVACTSCGNDSSPCTHSANNGCPATEVILHFIMDYENLSSIIILSSCFQYYVRRNSESCEFPDNLRKLNYIHYSSESISRTNPTWNYFYQRWACLCCTAKRWKPTKIRSIHRH